MNIHMKTASQKNIGKHIRTNIGKNTQRKKRRQNTIGQYVNNQGQHMLTTHRKKKPYENNIGTHIEQQTYDTT